MRMLVLFVYSLVMTISLASKQTGELQLEIQLLKRMVDAINRQKLETRNDVSHDVMNITDTSQRPEFVARNDHAHDVMNITALNWKNTDAFRKLARNLKSHRGPRIFDDGWNRATSTRVPAPKTTSTGPPPRARQFDDGWNRATNSTRAPSTSTGPPSTNPPTTAAPRRPSWPKWRPSGWSWSRGRKRRALAL